MTKSFDEAHAAHVALCDVRAMVAEAARKLVDLYPFPGLERGKALAELQALLATEEAARERFEAAASGYFGETHVRSYAEAPGPAVSDDCVATGTRSSRR